MPAAAPPGFGGATRRAHAWRPQTSSADAVVRLHAENLDAMRRLASAGFAGRFRCVYLDPPFNSGRRFVEYDDALDPGAWRAMMLERLAAARDLMSDDGAIFVEIDDTELGSLQCAMDDVFGRGQRISTITIVRSAATGHKAGNRGPVNVTDYLFVYAKDRARFRYNPVVRERTRYDAAYSTWLENPGQPADAWRFCPLRTHVRRVLGRAPTLAEVHAYAVDHAEQVVRFAQPRYEAVSREAQAPSSTDRGRRPGRVLRLERGRRKDLLLRGGNRITLARRQGDRERRAAGARRARDERVGRHRVPGDRAGGRRTLRAEQEAGEARRPYSRHGHRSGRLGARRVPGQRHDGRGRAVKMGRRWVGIERGAHVDALCIPRLRSVVDGADEAGVTRTFAWRGGGGFHVWT